MWLSMGYMFGWARLYRRQYRKYRGIDYDLSADVRIFNRRMLPGLLIVAAVDVVLLAWRLTW